MFVAIPKDDRQIGWCLCVVAKSKGQARRLLFQDNADLKEYDILEVKEQKYDIEENNETSENQDA